MAFYKGLSEKSKVHGDDFKNRQENTFVLKYTIKTSEARSMAFYTGLSEKSKVDGVDFKNR
ncbi:hypothetical protein T4B_6505 [Trichinella pseudospiralis]|uniref:Uncharacterized protein n=1 Tax=Trichinella pseudospiralis TaxID=6337 RepID=A0A0V1GJ11_TRIPS|nr:hypothetical protein T4B_6505 [Trichinella pseudospiralis]KRY98244.1 hypothetical protein T4C_11389 [Trichinella pseudospiralis]